MTMMSELMDVGKFSLYVSAPNRREIHDRDWKFLENVIESACKIASFNNDKPIEAVVNSAGRKYTVVLLGFDKPVNIEEFADMKKDKTLDGRVDTITYNMWVCGVYDKALQGGVEITLFAASKPKQTTDDNDDTHSLTARTPHGSPKQTLTGKKRGRSHKRRKDREGDGFFPSAYKYIKSAGSYLLDVAIPVWEEKVQQDSDSEYDTD